MKKGLLLLLSTLLLGCAAPKFIQAGQEDDVSVSYRWNHRAGKPSELLLKIVNASSSPQRMHLGLDLYYQAFTVEQFTADTCIPAGRTFNGKLNGIYFVPQKLTPEQAASPDTKVELTGYSVERSVSCP
ncbi:MAG: hypothetical protein IPO60_00475 [Flavobacteriales bacterium]|jgi:hypothetical protein|nr:hypothetical protein [Flavobacteriales bacterium]